MKILTILVALAIMPLAASTANAVTVLTMVSSWYGPGFNGNKMANGKTFRESDPTVAAHKSLPFGTKLELTNIANGKKHMVTVQDRGPYIKGRSLDVSRAAAKILGFVGRGVATLRVRIIRHGN